MFTDFDVDCVQVGDTRRLVAHELVLMGEWLATGREIPGCVLIVTPEEWDALNCATDDWLAGSEVLKLDTVPPVVADWVRYVGEVVLGEGVSVI